jgi:ribosomal protein L30E
MVDVNKALKDVTKKGTITIGKKQTKAAIQKGTAKLVVMANNCPYAEAITALVTEYTITPLLVLSLGIPAGRALRFPPLQCLMKGDQTSCSS